MPEHATESIEIDAPVEVVHAVLLAFEDYPSWAKDLKEVEVLERDQEGRGARVRFRAGAMGRSVTYTLGYDHSGAPATLPWVLEEGDIVRRLDGAYTLESIGDLPGTTRVTWTLDVELLVPIPGFVKRRAESLILRAALPELKAKIESGS